MTQPILRFGSAFTRRLALLASLFLLVIIVVSAQAAGEWTATGDMVSGPMSHPAALLADGQVLVPGGTTILGVVFTCSRASTQIFDPIADAWAATGSMSTGRALHTATTLNDGRVLVTGGVDCTIYISTTYNSAEIFDPVTGTWATTGSMNSARYQHTATLLNDGRVLVVGGNFGGAAAEVFDPATSAWTATGSMTASHSRHTATLLNDGRVLVASGATAEIFDPATGAWSATGSLSTARSSHTATLLNDGRVLIAGGHVTDGVSITYFDSVEIFDPATGAWSAAGSMSTARTRHTATLLDDGQVLVAGGSTSGATLASAEIFDPTTGTWTAAGSMIDDRKDHTATQLSDGRILAVGGDGSGRCCAEIFSLGGGSPPPPNPPILDVDFDGGTDGFSYGDDNFRGTNQPAYASGAHQSSGGNPDGVLQVLLGGIDNANISNMSGGWSTIFNLSSASNVTLSFDYNLTQQPSYESNEFSEALASVDGTLFVAATVTGNGNGGGVETTDWQTFTVNLGTLSAGNHTLTIGGFNNRKTFNNESTEVLIDNVFLTAP